MPVLMNQLTLEQVTDTETHHHWCPVCQKFWEHEGEYDSCPFKRVQACPPECFGSSDRREATNQSVVS